MKEVFSELEGGCEGSSVRACVREGIFVGESLFFFGCLELFLTWLALIGVA